MQGTSKSSLSCNANTVRLTTIRLTTHIINVIKQKHVGLIKYLILHFELSSSLFNKGFKTPAAVYTQI